MIINKHKCRARAYQTFKVPKNSSSYDFIHQFSYNNYRFPVYYLVGNIPTVCRLCHDNIQYPCRADRISLRVKSANLAWSSNTQSLVLKSCINTDVLYQNQCCGSGSGIRCLFDPGSGSGIWNRFFSGSRISDSGSRISDSGSRISDSGSRIPTPYFLELSDKFLGKKFYNSLKTGPNFFVQFCEIFGYKKGLTTNFFSPLSFVAVFGSGIGDPEWEKIRIRDKHPGSATLIKMLQVDGEDRYVRCPKWLFSRSCGVCLPATRVRDHGRQEHHLNKVDKPS